MRSAACPWIALAALALGCASPYGTIEGSTASGHLDQVEADLRANEFARALEHLAEVHGVSGLAPDVRAREERLIDEAARGRFAELAEGPEDELEDLFESELPARVRAQAGVLAAERLLAEDRRISAFRMIKRVQEELPGHPEWVAAGDVLARAGLSLIRDRRRYNLLLHYWPRGVQALEYLVIHYPTEPRCAEAYFALSQAYEADGDYDEAIARSQDLLLYHPESPYAPAASARLPYLRMARVRRDEYDRGELLKARAELSAWRAHYPGHELSGWVGELEHECAARLVRNDLYLASFYRQTESDFGQRLHAERARDLAREIGLEAEAAEAEQLLAGLPPAPDQPAGSSPPAPTQPDPSQPSPPPSGQP